MTEFTDITYEVDNGLAWITINRPDRYNAFRARTLDERAESEKNSPASFRMTASGVLNMVAIPRSRNRAPAPNGYPRRTSSSS